MATFGWKAGAIYCPHLSDAATAWFSCVLGMPWAQDGSGASPKLDQSTCENGFADWLTPWQKAPVKWVLLAKDTTVTPVQWKQVGASKPVTRGLALTAADRRTVVERCAARLHAYVRGHTDALGEEPKGDETPIFTYPLISPGIALLPSYLSDSVLGTSALLQVDRAELPPNAELVAAPVFDLSDGRATPKMDFQANGLIPYQGPSRTVGTETFSFHGVFVQSIPAKAYEHDSARRDAPHRFLTVRSRVPDRQLYATLSRQFSPLRNWLSAARAVGAPNYSGKAFCSLLVRLLGAGEDELVGADAVSSIYEMVLPREMYQAVFGAAHAERPTAARQMLHTFDAWISNDPSGSRVKDLLAQFAAYLATVGLEESRKRVADVLLASANDAGPVGASAIAAANALYDSLEQQHAAARAGWAAWLAAVLHVVAPPAAGANNRAAAIEFILEGAKAGMRDVTGQVGCILDDDVLRLLNGQIDYAPGFWEKVHDEADDVQAALASAKPLYIAPIVQRLAASEPNVAAELDKAYDQAARAVVGAAQESDPQADDPPLQLAFRPAAETRSTPESIRGCLLALRIGVPRSPTDTDWKKRAWITSAWAQPWQGDGKFGPEFVANGGGKALFCDTQGSTQSDGLDEQVAVYGGVPLLAADEEESPNPSMPEVFRAVPASNEVPALAYGARYGGFCVTVDNAGAIVEPQLRGAHPGEPLEPLPASHFDSDGTNNAPPPFRYLSRRPPGAPVFKGYEDWGVKQDTLTLRASGREPGAHHVAVLYSGAGYAEQKPSQDVLVLAPSVGPDFIQRWLAADALVDAGDPFRWESVRNMTLADVYALRQDAKSSKMLAFTHPAVSAVEISATWFNGNPLSPSHDTSKLQWKVEHFRSGQWIEAEALTLHVVQAPATAAHSFKLDATGRAINIVVPKGMQVRLEARSLIPEALIQGIYARLQKTALVMSDPTIVRPYVLHIGGHAYESREPQVMWIESLPEVPATEDIFDLDPADFRLRVPKSSTDAQEIALIFEPGPASPRSAHWIARVGLEHKRWQWSGYPIRFPASGSLESWLPLYAGVKDYMPELPTAGFSTKLVAGGQWELQSLVMKPIPLPAVRPANHMGIVAKAIPRFAKLMDAATLARAKPTYVFDHVFGVPRPGGERLSAPVWNEAIPMPQTVHVDAAGKVTQLSRGNLLVLADPLYDTSDTAAFGGIAERIEFDVVATWDVAKTPAAPRIVEAGPNPIFHGAPKSTEAQPGFAFDPVFGLTYDKALGGRAAQSGIVLRPSNTEGRWTLAKCHLRRFVMPELMLGTELPEAATRNPIGWSGKLGLRQVEQSWVPQDFVIYANAPIKDVQLPGYSIQLPTLNDTFARAYLVTWHRGPWAQAEPTWRPLVRLYERGSTFADWTLKRQLTPFDAGVADFVPLGKGEGSLAISYQGTARAYRIDVSDFTESRWLTFIGGFGLEVPPSGEQIEVVHAGIGYTVRPLNAAHMPRLGSKDDLRPSLLLVFAPQLDLMRGRIESEGGELVGVYAAKLVVPGSSVHFDEAILPCDRPPGECQALLIQVQRHNVESPEHVIAAGQWMDMVECLFPQESRNKEASLRFLPEYIGPLRITG